MKHMKNIVIILLFIINSMFLSSCWNYREIDDMSIVAGIAIDKDKSNGMYKITVELIDPLSSKETTGMASKIVEASGKTVDEAFLEIIQISGKKAYYSHSKILILSKDIDEEDLISIIDSVNRSTEMRGDMKLIVSLEKTAGEVLNKVHKEESGIASFSINNAIINRDNVSNFAAVDVWEFTEILFEQGVSPIAPGIELISNKGENTFNLTGSVSFQGGKNVQWFDEEESKAILILQDKLKGGLIVVNCNIDNKTYVNTLGIIKSKTKILPLFDENKIKLMIQVNMETSIDQLGGEFDFIEKKGRDILQEKAEIYLKKQIENVVKKTQQGFCNDIFGFSGIIMRKMPKEWKSTIQPKWREYFKSLEIDVDVNINIRDSGLISKPIKLGE
ncbi:Ger(x)C family spore germination protein [Clostridium grantii]|uniref:Spore germination protein KC n=1 Tax=Clostridium grantii DSM 8605 TaxID=1121316 RepID=A0A1M5QJI2_9CLOT|nr:Ger(x)C family spore germination protein [Clostridium grantii]SHH13713.1 spore germination protein KC [Clostridium grantii DSM 8605]